MTRYCVAAALSCVLVLVGCKPASEEAIPEDLDLVILNGRVMDPETKLDAVRNVGRQGRQDRRRHRAGHPGEAKPSTPRVTWSRRALSIRITTMC